MEDDRKKEQELHRQFMDHYSLRSRCPRCKDCNNWDECICEVECGSSACIGGID